MRSNLRTPQAAECVPIEPLSSTHPLLKVEDAYAIQHAVADRRLAAGRLFRTRTA